MKTSTLIIFGVIVVLLIGIGIAFYELNLNTQENSQNSSNDINTTVNASENGIGGTFLAGESLQNATDEELASS